MANVKTKIIFLADMWERHLMKATPSLSQKLLVHVLRHRGFQAKAQELAADGKFYTLTTTRGDR